MKEEISPGTSNIEETEKLSYAKIPIKIQFFKPKFYQQNHRFLDLSVAAMLCVRSLIIHDTEHAHFGVPRPL